MACFGVVAACPVVHSYSVEDGFALADGLVAVEVYTVAEEPAAGVALAGSEQPVHFGVVLDAVLLGAADSAYYCPVQLALDNP